MCPVPCAVVEYRQASLVGAIFAIVGIGSANKLCGGPLSQSLTPKAKGKPCLTSSLWGIVGVRGKAEGRPSQPGTSIFRLGVDSHSAHEFNFSSKIYIRLVFRFSSFIVSDAVHSFSALYTVSDITNPGSVS
jgi:hypothetical protein